MSKSRKGIPNKVTAAAKAETASFFKEILNEQREAELWHEFMLGMQTNIIKWQAFKRAVEYKRGMPTQAIEGNLTISYTEALTKMRQKRESS